MFITGLFLTFKQNYLRNCQQLWTKELRRRRNVRGVFLSWLAKIKVEARLLRMARFLRLCSIHVALSLAVEKGLSGVHSSYLRHGCWSRASRCSRWLFSPRRGGGRGGGSGEGPLLPPSQKWLLSARSTWLIAGVILARLTFGIKWQLRSPPGAATRRRESLGRKFRSLAGEHKSWLQITAITHCAEASARIFQPRAESAIPLPTTWRDRAHYFSTLPGPSQAHHKCLGNNQDITNFLQYRSPNTILQKLSIYYSDINKDGNQDRILESFS